MADTNDLSKQHLPEKKNPCTASTPLCSGELVKKYSVNGSKAEGKTFAICGPCAVYIKRGGSKLEEVSEEPSPT